MAFTSYLIFVLPTFLASVFFSLLAKYLAPKLGFMDHPDAERKLHNSSTPVMGGIGMTLGMLAGVVITLLISPNARSIWDLHGEFITTFFGTAVMYCCLGAIDDKLGLRPIVKLLGQIICAAPFIFIFPDISAITFFEFSISTGVLTPLICLVWIVFLVNAFNLMDGSDGLAGMLAVVTLLASAVLLLSQLNLHGLLLAVMAIGTILGFLVFNLPPASMFMGDAGSMMLGFMVATLTLLASMNTATQLNGPVPLLLVGVPLLDTALAFLRRFLKGKSWRDADREHIHHRLIDRGFSPTELLTALTTISLLFSAIGVFVGGGKSDITVLLISTLAFAVLVSTRVIGEIEFGLLRKIALSRKVKVTASPPPIKPFLHEKNLFTYKKLQNILVNNEFHCLELWIVPNKELQKKSHQRHDNSISFLTIVYCDQGKQVSSKEGISENIIEWAEAVSSTQMNARDEWPRLIDSVHFDLNSDSKKAA